MKSERYVEKILIDNAIHLIAEGGFEKATTKNLAFYNKETCDIKMNEVYIYRLFGSKEALYRSAFFCLEEELVGAFRDASAIVGDFACDTQRRLYEFFLKTWRFILNNEDHCRCYVRYYYSVYFKDKASERHNQQFTAIVNKMQPLFKEEADVRSILHSVFTTLLDFAIRVYNGELEDNEINRPHIFNVLYCMIMTYLREPKKTLAESLIL